MKKTALFVLFFTTSVNAAPILMGGSSLKARYHCYSPVRLQNGLAKFKQRQLETSVIWTEILAPIPWRFETYFGSLGNALASLIIEKDGEEISVNFDGLTIAPAMAELALRRLKKASPLERALIQDSAEVSIYRLQIPEQDQTLLEFVRDNAAALVPPDELNAFLAAKSEEELQGLHKMIWHSLRLEYELRTGLTSFYAIQKLAPQGLEGRVLRNGTTVIEVDDYAGLLASDLSAAMICVKEGSNGQPRAALFSLLARANQVRFLSCAGILGGK